MRKMLTSILCMAAAAAALAQPAARDERRQALFNMSEAEFDAELAARFQYPPPAPKPAIVDDPAQGRALDAAYFQAFPRFDRAYSPTARKRAAALAASLVRDARTLSHEQFVLRVAEIAALADNAHTAIGENALRKGTPRIPLRTFLFADGLHVLYADPANAELLGARIETIAGQPIDSIFRQVSRYLGGSEARRRLQLIPMLESPALLRAAGIATAPDRLMLGGVLANGRPFERTIPAEQRDRAAWVSNTIRLLFPGLNPPARPLVGLMPSSASLPVYLRSRTKLFTIEDLPAAGLYLGLTYNADGDDEKIGPFLADALSRVRSQQPAYVVVDMRMNGGGDYTTTYDFARALPAAAGGKPIYVLTSPWTFSAAITTVAALEQAGGGQVTIVGEPVGDRLDFWAEGGSFILPNSGVQVHYTAARHNYAGPCADRRSCFWLNELYPVLVRSLKPDIAAPLTFSAYRRQVDPALEAILERQSGGRR